MQLRSLLTPFALLACAELATLACVNSDPVDDDMPAVTATASVSTSAAATTAPPPVDNTMCGGDFTGAGDFAATPMCTNAKPVNCNITSFDGDSYALGADAAHWDKDTWQVGVGTDQESLSGGIYMYLTEGGVPLVRALESDTNGDGFLHITGNVLAGNYAGVVFWFGPCQDATPFTGLQFSISGGTGTGTMQVQIQTDENSPTDGSKGSCDPTLTPELDKYEACKSNSYAIGGFTPETAYEFFVPFSEFKNGKPIAEVHPNQVLGLQIQIDCGDVDCPVDLHLNDLRFYRGDHAPALGTPPVAEPATTEPAGTEPAPAAADTATAATDPAPARTMAAPAVTGSAQ